MKKKKKEKKTIINKEQQILKCRDDKEPVIQSRVNEQDDAEPFRLADGHKCSWKKAILKTKFVLLTSCSED